MHSLFGIPVGSLALVLTVLIGIGLGVVAAFAVRNRIFLRLGLRNVGRRRSRGALIVVGLMLGTAIITAALATGDTMSQTIRSGAIDLAREDRRGDRGQGDRGGALRPADRCRGRNRDALPPRGLRRRGSRAAARATGLVAGVAPVIVETIAVQDVTSRQNEPPRDAVRERPGPSRRLRRDPRRTAGPCRSPTCAPARCT